MDPRRRLLLDWLQAALRRVHGRHAVREALASLTDSRGFHVAAIGKAAASMALGAHDALGPRVRSTLVITKDGHVDAEAARLPGVEVHESAHPLPDDRSIAAGERLLTWAARDCAADGQPLVLVSGGASSLVEAPAEGVTLEELVDLNTGGLAAGLDIVALNARRSRLSRIKGGRFAARLAGRGALALFISDVPGDDPDVIGSGLMGRLEGREDDIERRVVASIDAAVDAAAAAARQSGLECRAGVERFEGEASRLAVRFVHEIHMGTVPVHIWGGESTMTLPANPGRGGRNQHLALTAARLMSGHDDLLLMAVGTDGTDGPTAAAGAIVDGETCARISLADIVIEDALAGADSGTALAAAGDLLDTGPTGTNVGDLVIGLRLAR